ncbi:MAG: hypothetical protein HN919_10070 [Verrucomicrobia bacterium]|jgi:hypothetical protein|nr:hypothetical protein [Verrucomicrobiota bacterium]MBT7066637.1 hypothetical protein [Verrucomicrobiota bacterium]MBT7700390.1 hypothetical protein [Verrucomicrobiota bacterium]
MIKRRNRVVVGLLSVAIAAGSLLAGAKEIPEHLPKCSTKAPDATKPLKVFLMSGQSNMVGMGHPGPLKKLIDEEGMFTNLVDAAGNWAVRNDVFFVSLTNKRIARWMTIPIMGRTLGPEAQFGHIMGYYHDEVVLIIKIAQGNRSISFDVMPPSSRIGFPKEGKYYKGWQYDAFIADAHKILDNLQAYYPDYKGQGYEIAGFCWWQGHKDGGLSQRYYERHLVNLINDFRAEFKAPKAPFVVATVGFGGMGMGKKYLEILKAQMAVSDPVKYPQFAGNVKSFDTRTMGGGGYHYDGNGATYTRVGDAMGRAMAELLDERVEK